MAELGKCMAKKEIMIFADYSHAVSMTLQEVCDICGVSQQFVGDLIDYDIIHPKRISEHEWQFTLTDFQRIKRALRIKRDLEINLAGVALVLDLLDQVEELQAEMNLFERHYL